MSNLVKSKLTGLSILFFAFIVPGFITFTTYASLESQEQSTEITVKLIGIVIILFLGIGILKWQKNVLEIR